MRPGAFEVALEHNRSRGMKEYWDRHPLQKALHSVKAKEMAEVRKAYRELRKAGA